MEVRNQFTFYLSYLDVVEHLPADQQLDMYQAIARFGLLGEEPDYLSPGSVPAFLAMRPNLLSGRKKALAAMEKKKKEENKKKKKIENEIKTETKDDSPKELGGAFEIFWEKFPNKIAKDKARQIWRRQKPCLDQVLEGLERWRNSLQWERENGRYIPRAWRFLEEKAYLEIPEEKPVAGAIGNLGQAEIEAIRQVMSG